jgi:hypothetical protein
MEGSANGASVMSRLQCAGSTLSTLRNTCAQISFCTLQLVTKPCVTRPPPPLSRLAALPPYSDAKVANRDVGGFGWEMSSRGRYVTPADSPLHDGSPYRELRVGRWGLGCVHRSRASICRPVPNPNRPIRNFVLIAVDHACECMRRPTAALNLNRVVRAPTLSTGRRKPMLEMSLMPSIWSPKYCFFSPLGLAMRFGSMLCSPPPPVPRTVSLSLVPLFSLTAETHPNNRTSSSQSVRVHAP